MRSPREDRHDGVTTTETVIPLAVEELVVDVRTKETARVRVRKTVETEDVMVDAPHAHEDVTVERVLRDLEVDAPPPVRIEGDTTIVSVVEEVVVFHKRYVVREEIRITRRRVEDVRAFKVARRREHAEVIDVPVTQTPEPEAASPREQDASLGGPQEEGTGGEHENRNRIVR